MYDKMALLWVLADIEWLNENPNSEFTDRPSQFFRNPDKLADWAKNGTSQHDLLKMSEKATHYSDDGYYSLAQVCVAFRTAGFERDIENYFFNYRLLHAFLLPNRVNQDLAKWVKYSETSRFESQFGISLKGEKKQVKSSAGPEKAKRPASK